MKTKVLSIVSLIFLCGCLLTSETMGQERIPYHPYVHSPNLSKIIPQMVQYNVTLYTDHKDTNGISFLQHIRIYANPESTLAYRAVYKDVFNTLVVIPLETGGVLFVPQPSIKGIKIVHSPKKQKTTLSMTKPTNYLTEIPNGPTVRLDKLPTYDIMPMPQ